MKLKEIAAKINAHLRRFEADKKINAEFEATKGVRLHPFYHAGAHASGAYVRVVYVAYQGAVSLRKEEAMAYLAWLDAGNVGRHYDAPGSKRRAGQ